MSELLSRDKEVNQKDKIKVTEAEIVVHGTVEKPYYEIKYFDIADQQYHIGYSSYYLEFVFKWLNECFEIVGEKEILEEKLI